MGGRGVDDANCLIIDQGHGFPSGIVRQAQNHDVGAVQRFFAGANVLSVGIRQLPDGQLPASGQPLADFQPSGAGGAVYENFCTHLVTSPTELGALVP